VNAAEDSAACLRCGVCCFSRLETYVRVEGADWARLGDDAERLAHFVGNRAYLRMTGDHCTALKERRAEDGTREWVCSIYARRPQVCRDLARGSPECLAEQELKRDRPLEL
jgi:uncharacterized protein